MEITLERCHPRYLIMAANFEWLDTNSRFKVLTYCVQVLYASCLLIWDISIYQSIILVRTYPLLHMELKELLKTYLDEVCMYWHIPYHHACIRWTWGQECILTFQVYAYKLQAKFQFLGIGNIQEHFAGPDDRCHFTETSG